MRFGSSCLMLGALIRGLSTFPAYEAQIEPRTKFWLTFTGQVIHSHNYRRPEDFKDRNVIILGGGASGTDISIELSASASSVYLAHNNPPLPTVLPDNVHENIPFRKRIEICPRHVVVHHASAPARRSGSQRQNKLQSLQRRHG